MKLEVSKSVTIFYTSNKICLPKLFDFSRNQNVDRNQRERIENFPKHNSNNFCWNNTKTIERNSEFKSCFSVDHALEKIFGLFKLLCAKKRGRGTLTRKPKRFSVPQTLQLFDLLFLCFIFFSYTCIVKYQ